MDEFGYVHHSLKKEFKSPNNLVLEKEHKTEISLYDHNKLELERQRVKCHYNEWKGMTWDKKWIEIEKISKEESRLESQKNRHGKQCAPVLSQTD
jgi:hypothetical protein